MVGGIGKRHGAACLDATPRTQIMSFIDKAAAADTQPVTRPSPVTRLSNDEQVDSNPADDLPKEIEDQLKALIQSLDRYAA